MTYTLVAGWDGVLRDSDGAAIAPDLQNLDWQAYQAWLAAGNTPAAAPTPPAAPPAYDFLSFLALLTTAEQGALVSSTDPRVKVFCLMAAGAPTILLADPRVIGSIQLCASLGLLGSDRAAQILAGSPAPAA